MINKLHATPVFEDASLEPSKDVKVPLLSTTVSLEVDEEVEELISAVYEITPTSASLFLWNEENQFGYEISYTSIILFAIESQVGIYLQIGTSAAEDSPIEVRFRIEQPQDLYEALSRAAAFHDSLLESEDESLEDTPTNGAFDDRSDDIDGPPSKHQRRL